VIEPEKAGTDAIPKDVSVLAGGNEFRVCAYEIGGEVYFKLRDIAAVMNGTEGQFEIAWDGAEGAIHIFSGSPYTPAGGEFEEGGGVTEKAHGAAVKIYADGTETALAAYTIKGNNYFRLEDISGALDFTASWDVGGAAVAIDTAGSADETEREAGAAGKQGL
jgi:hypothetical protein